MRSASWQAIGTSVQLIVTRHGALRPAAALLRVQLAELDRTCSRFRPDSELRRLVPGRQQVSAVLAQVVRAALTAAEQTGGLVDPGLGAALVRAGYDRTFAELPGDSGRHDLHPEPARWRDIACDGDVLDLPLGLVLDLGATAKAWAADRAATAIGTRLDTGVLVNLGGDLAVAGPAPAGGWTVDVGGAVVALDAGGLATSSTQVRTWRSGGTVRHHVLDPRTGAPAVTPWASASVAAATCLEANTASTAAVVLGTDAPDWLAARGLPSRLTDRSGRVVVVGGWPLERAA